MPERTSRPASATKGSAAGSHQDVTAEIDAIISGFDDWRGATLSQLRASIMRADRSMVEEVKWKKPSRPSGVPVWSHDGIVCIGEALKSAVRLTFPKGALLEDRAKFFNARLDSKTVRAIDVREGEKIDKPALKRLIAEAIAVNGAKTGT
jgi:hypothetical protein